VQCIHRDHALGDRRYTMWAHVLTLDARLEHDSRVESRANSPYADFAAADWRRQPMVGRPCATETDRTVI